MCKILFKMIILDIVLDYFFIVYCFHILSLLIYIVTYVTIFYNEKVEDKMEKGG